MNNHIPRPLLSICIPTYNRAPVLDQSLCRLMTLIGDDPEVEVIVSDNNSDDDTVNVVRKYKKVRYYKNEQNIKDANFTVALSHGTGEYLKLLNDTIYLTKEGIIKIKDELRARLSEKRPVIFCQNRSYRSDDTASYGNVDELLSIMTVDITWIAVFGIWRTQFEEISDKNRWVKTQFLQVDWIIRNACQHPYGDIVYDNFFEYIPLKKKGGYNLFKTFINNYLGLLKHFQSEKVISQKTFNFEKKNLYQLDLLPWLPLVFINNDNIYEFDTKGSWELLFKTYAKHVYFWGSMPKLCFLFIKNLLRKWI